jgi:hypothetical protein
MGVVAKKAFVRSNSLIHRKFERHGGLMFQSQTVDSLQFDFYPPKPVVVQRRDRQLTSDAGLVPIRQFDRRWGYTRRLSRCLGDGRSDPQHSIDAMLA